MDYLRKFFDRKNKKYRNFPIIIVSVTDPVQIFDVNRLGYLKPSDYVPKPSLPSIYELYSFVNPFKRIRDIEPHYPAEEVPAEEQEMQLLGIPLNNLEEFVANIPLQMQNWVQTQEQAALAAMEATAAELNSEVNLEVEGTAMAISPSQQESNADDPGDEEDVVEDNNNDDSVNVHVQELVETTVTNAVGAYEEARHYEGAGAVGGGEAIEVGSGDVLPLEREVGAGDDEVGPGVVEEPPNEEIEEDLVEDVQEPSTSGMSGYTSSGTQTDYRKYDEEWNVL